MKVQITAIEYDFECDDENEVLPESYQVELTNETIGKVYDIFEDPEYPDEDRLMYLADMISDETGWCIKTLEFVEVLSMTQTEWDEMYRKLYDAYDYAGLRNEYVRKNLGELLDYMIQYKERFSPVPVSEVAQEMSTAS